MSADEIKSAVQKATDAFEEIPFKELMTELQRRLGDRRALAYRPALVAGNQVLRFILDDLSRP